MVDYMSLEEQVSVDFGRARRRAFFRGLKARFMGGRDRLLSFDETRRALGADSRFYLGRKVVEVSKIVGSVDRYREFDRDFMPMKASMSTRWKRIDRALRRGEELPAVSLYKIGDAYFVSDGNHRVSTSHYQGVEMIDAEVTEFGPRSSANLEIPEPGLATNAAC
jgi:hypothetical protein